VKRIANIIPGVIFLVLLCNSANSQITPIIFEAKELTEGFGSEPAPVFKNHPAITKSPKSLQIIVGATGGFLVPTGDLKGEISTISLSNPVTTSKSYFENWGYSLGVEFKLPTASRDDLRITFSTCLNSFFNSGTDSSGIYSVEPTLKSIQTGLGIEYAIAVSKKVKVHLSAGLTGSLFYGTIDIRDSAGYVRSLTYNPNRRYGIEGGVGGEYKITENVGVSAGLKYHLANLFGRDFDATGAHDLNDKEFLMNGVSIESKSISFFRLRLGLCVYVFD